MDWAIAVLTTAATAFVSAGVAWWFGRRAETHRRILDMKATAYVELIEAWLAVLLELQEQIEAGNSPRIGTCKSVPRMMSARMKVVLFGAGSAVAVLARGRFDRAALVELANVIRSEFGAGVYETDGLTRALGANPGDSSVVVAPDQTR